MIWLILLIVAVVVFVICLISWRLNFKKIMLYILNYNSMVCGMRGTGKDRLYSGIISEMPVKGYISNTDYKVPGKEFLQLDFSKLNIMNTYDNFISGHINYYRYEYPEKYPIFISDCGVYFPSAYQSEIMKKYPGIANFMPLSRHLGNTNISCNLQVPSQLWDKIRNQCDIYISCRSCLNLPFGFVFAKVRVYEKYDSFASSVPPYRAPQLGLSAVKSGKAVVDTHKISYMASYGKIQSFNIFYRSKSNYDTRFFKEYLEKGLKK